MENSSAPRQRQRLVVLIVIIFVAIVSFFTGKQFGSKTYVDGGVGGRPSSTVVTDHTTGIPPDSLR